jgi:hypothetical protein
MNKIEEILGTTKGEYETWADVFKRIDEANGIDVRTLTRVVVAILEGLYGENNRTKGIDYSITSSDSTESGYFRIDSGTEGFTGTHTEIQDGSG